ncbi:MAG TPA: hypothetical protein VGH32_00575 [Pirellulales bacterium]
MSARDGGEGACRPPSPFVKRREIFAAGLTRFVFKVLSGTTFT